MPPQIQAFAVSLSQTVEAFAGKNGKRNAEGGMSAPFHRRVLSRCAVGVANDDPLARAMLGETVFELFQLFLPFLRVFFGAEGKAETAPVGQADLLPVPFDSRFASRRLRVKNAVAFQQGRSEIFRHS